ncbi:MAG: HAD hydrolase-like protein, partial [Candidatus Heimdallarchaeaceae archaeon]
MNEAIPIFIDFGGTLVDTLEITKKMFKQTVNKEFTSEQIKAMYKEASKKRTSMTLFFKYPVNPIKLMINQKKFRTIQNELFLSDVKLFPQVKETLDKIKKLEEVQLILVTQNPSMEDEEQSTLVMEKLFGSEHPFDMI